MAGTRADGWPVLARHERAAEWLQIWTDLGRAPRTIDAYARGLAEYLEACERDGVDPLAATRAQLAVITQHDHSPGNAQVVSAADLVELERLAELERLQAFAFSACTFDVNGMTVIVYNPLRSELRQHSDVAHELAHLLLKHELTEIREVAGLPFRTCRPDQEEEATALGGTLLLPRPLLLRAASRGMDIDDISRTYAVTPEMAMYRLNTTGVVQQISRARAQYS